MAAVPTPVWGQWTGTNPLWTNSNVGIGTTAPATYRHLKGPNALWRGQLSLEATDYIQISFYGGPTNQTNSKFRMFYDVVNNQMNFQNDTGAPFLFKNGNVGIGTTNPQYKLAVNGNIGAQDIIVTNTGWSDYVFRPGYRLRPLSEVSQYIQANGHLPDIPTEEEVKEKGVSLGDMQAKLLAKVEELTLHMIQQEEENRELRDRLARLEKAAGTDSTPASAK
jgi:hypothetical protein